jgi:hypothetical protein
LRYDDADDEQMELSNVAVTGGLNGQKELFRTEPDWTMQVTLIICERLNEGKVLI